MTPFEQTFIIIKPDAVKRQLVGKIIQRFENKGLVLVDMKMATMTDALVQEHYPHLVEKSFFHEISTFMTSGPVVYLILEGPKAVAVVREMIGETDALKASPGTIRGDLGAGYDYHENIVHASDSTETAHIEIKRFFG